MGPLCSMVKAQLALHPYFHPSLGLQKPVVPRQAPEPRGVAAPVRREKSCEMRALRAELLVHTPMEVVATKRCMRLGYLGMGKKKGISSLWLPWDVLQDRTPMLGMPGLRHAGMACRHWGAEGSQVAAVGHQIQQVTHGVHPKHASPAACPYRLGHALPVRCWSGG